MKIGIIGPPKSGKTAIFNILLQGNASGNIGVFRSSDQRLENLSKIFASKKVTYPELAFVDIGPDAIFNRKALSGLQDIDLFICVIDAFFNEDPKKAFEGFLTDIMLSDLEAIQNRIDRLQKEKSRGSEQESKVLEKCCASISDGRLLYKADLDADEKKQLSGLMLLSLKPLILAINISEHVPGDMEVKIRLLEEYCASKDIRCIRFFGKIGLELIELEQKEREGFLKEMGAGYNIREDISRLIFRELDLITFFTAGEKESRGWYLKSGLSVLEAAGKIHSDIKRGFIRAEVVSYDDFIKFGSMHKAKERGALRLEGKEYVVKEGDIINIRFSV